jgi:hypothetical protein
MRPGCSAFRRTLAFGIAVVSLLPIVVAGQTSAAPKARASKKSAALPRTPWGDPDLEGLWTNTTTTPLERLPEASDKQVLTDEERAALAGRVAERLNQDRQPARPGQIVAYNEFWYERGTLNNRTSLIIDPPDGKLPPFTPEAQNRYDAWAKVRADQRFASAQEMGAYDRCITRGMPGAMLPGFYNHNYHILQTPAYVAIVVEMIHDARIIPVDGRPHLNKDLRQWLGDPRGHWEGDTLVVETTNLNDKVFERAAAIGFGGNMRMVERFRRIDADTIDYQFTVNDATTFTRPWTVAAPMTKVQGPLYEYACHEGNYAVAHALSGSRAEEKAVADEAKKE